MLIVSSFLILANNHTDFGGSLPLAVLDLNETFLTYSILQMEDGGLELLPDAVQRFPLREEFADSLEHPD